MGLLVTLCCLIVSPTLVAAEPTQKPPMLAVLVAQTFLRSVADRDLKTAAPLLAQAVNFDGQQVRGTRAVRKRLARLLQRVGRRRRMRKVVVLGLEHAVRLFGSPPQRLALPKGPLVVGFGRLQRRGLIVFLAPIEDRWRVVAVTD